QAALQNAPEDYFLRENFALFLQATGNVPQAAAEWQRVHDLLPYDSIAYFQLGWTLQLQGQWADAEASFRRAVELRPTMIEGWIALGNVLDNQGKYPEALACFASAHRRWPRNGVFVFCSGKVLAH